MFKSDSFLDDVQMQKVESKFGIEKIFGLLSSCC